MKVSDLKFIERNFRFMDQKTFSALVSNIKKDKFLTSTPLVMKKDDDYIIISGNHRVKACIDAGIDEIYCIVFDYLNVTEDDILRLQISHNLLSGKDDINILEELYNQIKDVT
ncbi:MAG: ParB N-terminal domain-containing protein [Ignavibacteria bacterium]|nr:ParB N-terminal domain-containing protein [Ignavibacteria bacterium]